MPAPSPAPRARGDFDRIEALHDLVLRSLDDDQAQDVVSIPLTGKSNIADYMVIASGRSTRQVASMAQKLTEKIKQAFFNFPWDGSGLATEFKREAKFIPIEYKKDWAVLRKIDEASGVKYTCK